VAEDEEVLRRSRGTVCVLEQIIGLVDSLLSLVLS
jgi:hypothetical protein